MSNKKGQITIFIIVGIIILAGVGLYTAMRSETIKNELSTGLELSIEEVPIEFRPVNSFVETCLAEISKEGLTKLGERGGFIDLIRNNIITKTDPTNSDAVQFSPDSELSIPYWWHLDSPNECAGSCQFKSIPEDQLFLTKTKGQINNKPSIESQLEDYIKENMDSCLNNFETLEGQGFKIEVKGEIEPKVTITQEDIIFYLNYPLEAEKYSQQEISEFFIRLPLNLQRIYGLATQLTNMQGEYHFLERDVLNLLVGYSAVNKNKLPPMAETRFEIGNPIIWQKSKVRANVKELLTKDIQLLQVYGTSNYEPYSFPGNSLLESLYNKGMLIPGAVENSNLEVRFKYIPWQDIYFDLNCKGEQCEPESAGVDFIIPMGIQNYNFVYALSFPVEVEIYDPFALNNQGYRFKFFLEGNIRQNEPMKSDFTPAQSGFLESTMLCDSDKRTSGEITINVNDYVTEKNLDGVQIVYSSYEENCLIGTTINGTFKGQFPVMMGGAVSLIKDGYLRYSQRFDTKINAKDQLEINLKPKLTKKFTVRKKLMEKGTYGWSLGNETNLREDEEATIIISRNSNLQEQDYSSFAEYKGNQSEKGEIEIAPGTYELNINLVYNKQISIPQLNEYRQYGIENDYLDEGFRVGGTSINYTFTKEALKKDEIIFYVLNPDILSIPEGERNANDINQIAGVDEESRKYKGSLIPKFK